MATLAGTIKWSDSHKPVGKAVVKIVRKTTVLSTDSNSKGKYKFLDVTPGKYAMTVEADGAIADRRTVTVVKATPTTEDVELRHAQPTTTTTSTTSTTTSTTSTTTTTVPPTTTTVPATTTTSTPPRSIPMGTTITIPTSSTGSSTSPVSSGGSTAPTAPPSRSSQAFDELMGLVTTGSDFAVSPPVNIDEARQFRRLYTVGNYVIAGVVRSIGALNTILNSSTPTGTAGAASTLPLLNKQALVDAQSANIDSIIARSADNTRNEGQLLEAVRSQFDLGTAAAPNVNIAFKTVFRDFVALCANDLLGVDPLDPKVNASLTMDPKRIEEIYTHLKRTKRGLIHLVETMSAAGTLGSSSLVEKWARLVKDSLSVLAAVKPFIGDDDEDRRHVWSVTAELNRVPKASIDAYVVHAREGGQLLNDSIDVYGQLSATQLNDESQTLLRDFFFDTAKFGIGGESVSTLLRRNAQLIQENWIPAWS